MRFEPLTGFICANRPSHVRYDLGLTALISEAVRRTGSFCCHNGGRSTLCSQCGWLCELLHKMHQNSPRLIQHTGKSVDSSWKEG